MKNRKKIVEKYISRNSFDNDSSQSINVFKIGI